jgi:hypothetical protein
MARPKADQGKKTFFTLIPCALASVQFKPTQATSGVMWASLGITHALKAEDLSFSANYEVVHLRRGAATFALLAFSPSSIAVNIDFNAFGQGACGHGLDLEHLQVKAFGVHFLPALQIMSGLRVVSLRCIDEPV